jgi:tRNA threonylcarbamoyladenosine biosynthesis protein TsaB
MCNSHGTVLALDTCGAEATLALGEMTFGPFSLLRESRLGVKTASSLLTRALRDLLGEMKPEQLRAIVVVRGPGSFTGMRIGLSAAKALAEAAQVPVVGLSRLAVLAETNQAEFVALDAGRGSVYLGCFGNGSNTAELLTPDEVWSRELGVLTVCEDKLTTLFPKSERVAEPTAWTALQYASARVEAGDWDDVATVDALYLWRPEQMLRASASPAVL